MQQQHHAAPDAVIYDVDVLTQEEYQEQQADRLMQDVFSGEENAGSAFNELKCLLSVTFRPLLWKGW